MTKERPSGAHDTIDANSVVSSTLPAILNGQTHQARTTAPPPSRFVSHARDRACREKARGGRRSATPQRTRRACSRTAAAGPSSSCRRRRRRWASQRRGPSSVGDCPQRTGRQANSAVHLSFRGCVSSGSRHGVTESSERGRVSRARGGVMWGDVTWSNQGIANGWLRRARRWRRRDPAHAGRRHGQAG